MKVLKMNVIDNCLRNECFRSNDGTSSNFLSTLNETFNDNDNKMIYLNFHEIRILT